MLTIDGETYRCGSCRFYVPSGQVLTEGACVCMPPAMFPLQQKGQLVGWTQVRPTVNALTDFCGQWQPNVRASAQATDQAANKQN